jgi:hypothetical protein
MARLVSRFLPRDDAEFLALGVLCLFDALGVLGVFG